MTRRAGIDSSDVLGAAANLVDTQGLEALSLTALAEHLGVKTPSLYNHVAGLGALRQQLAVLGTRQLGASLAKAAVGKSADDAVWAMSRAYRAYVHEHPGLYAASVRSADPSDVELQAAEAEVLDTVLQVLSAYGLAGDEAIHAARGLRSVVHGFATLEAGGGFGIALDLDESFSRLIRIFLDGLRSGKTFARLDV